MKKLAYRGRVLAEEKRVEPRGDVVPVLHPKPQGKDQLEQGRRRDGGGAEAHLFGRSVEASLYHQELLVFGGPCQGLLDGGDLVHR